MQIAISIEPYLGVEKTKLTQYIDNIVQLSRDFKLRGDQVVLHFDYFKSNPEVFRLVQGYANQIDIDLHLMQEPAPSFDGFRSVAFDVMAGLQMLSEIPLSRRGLVLDLDCDWREYVDLVQSVSYIIVMTVKCGKSGQTFQPAALTVIPQIRALNPRATIIIDGGVNENNIDLLKNAGVDVVVVGNYAKKCYENGDLAIGINRLLHK
ncbi:MAG: hypothetical protein J5580_00370 [Clostridia bacterium]|nr:hypothetical protein [Clostridia bacterium]